MTQERFEELEQEHQEWMQTKGAELLDEYNYFGDDFYAQDCY